MGPDTAAVPKTESSEESPEDVVLKVISESDSSDISAPTEPESSLTNISDKCYPCSTCGKVFDRPSKLERHKPVHLRKPKPLHQCQHCDHKCPRARERSEFISPTNDRGK
ncbi:zinc finger protein 580-like isoform X2 [Channa argus]|uniref:zinc finger protein 580-like isoform X2 n=1 Tax=Channa argus TaxID=215402 RepID=UPI002944D840|nr:hypothetical protein Q8A73_003479 [Channa argus]